MAEPDSRPGPGPAAWGGKALRGTRAANRARTGRALAAAVLLASARGRLGPPLARRAAGGCAQTRMRVDSEASVRGLGLGHAYTQVRVRADSPLSDTRVRPDAPSRVAGREPGRDNWAGTRSGQAPGSSRVSQSGARSESVRHRDGGRLGYGGAAGAAGAGPSFPPRARLSAQKARKVCSARLHRGN